MKEPKVWDGMTKDEHNVYLAKFYQKLLDESRLKWIRDSQEAIKRRKEKNTPRRKVASKVTEKQ